MKTNILLAGVGGQGVLTLGLIISRAALEQGENVIMSEIHGLAQRGGSVTAEVRIGNFRAPIIPDGDVDLTIGMEPLETMRSLSRAPTGSRVIMSTEKLAPVSLSIRHEEYPDLRVLTESISDNFHLGTIDAVSVARKSGSFRAANIAILGFAIGTGWLNLSLECTRNQIRAIFSKKSLEINLKALEAGLEMGKSAQQEFVERLA